MAHVLVHAELAQLVAARVLVASVVHCLVVPRIRVRVRVRVMVRVRFRVRVRVRVVHS